MGGLTKARLDRRMCAGIGAIEPPAAPLSEGLAASGQDITSSLTKSCAAMEGRKGMPPETTSRRFPPPWTIDEATESFCIRDANGRALAFVYFEEEPGRRAARPTC